MNNTINEEILNKYFGTTSKALKKIKEILPKSTHLYNISKDFYDMAERYFNDAKYFKEKKDYINAFGSLNYAHGWLDAGARLGLWDVEYDNKLFTVDDAKKK